LADVANLSAEDRLDLLLALAAAEPTDVVFLDIDGNVVDPEDVNASAHKVQIVRSEDVDVSAAGLISATADGYLFLGSEIDMKPYGLIAGDRAQLKSQTNPTNAHDRADGINVTSGHLVLEAEDGSIGTAEDRIMTDLPSNTTLTARANDTIYIVEATPEGQAGDDGNLNVLAVNARRGDFANIVELTALNGSILDGAHLLGTD